MSISYHSLSSFSSFCVILFLITVSLIIYNYLNLPRVSESLKLYFQHTFYLQNTIQVPGPMKLFYAEHRIWARTGPVSSLLVFSFVCTFLYLSKYNINMEATHSYRLNIERTKLDIYVQKQRLGLKKKYHLERQNMRDGKAIKLDQILLQKLLIYI